MELFGQVYDVRLTALTEDDKSSWNQPNIWHRKYLKQCFQKRSMQPLIIIDLKNAAQVDTGIHGQDHLEAKEEQDDDPVHKDTEIN